MKKQHCVVWKCGTASNPAKLIHLWLFSLSPGFLIQVFLLFKTGANRFTCFMYGWWGELITWCLYRPFELVRNAEVLNGIELTIHANPNYSTCGIFVANPLHASGVELLRVGADWDSASHWYAVLETCTLATSSARCFALSKLENYF